MVLNVALEDSDAWWEHGGSYARIWNGLLMVNHEPWVHDDVEAFLEDLAASDVLERTPASMPRQISASSAIILRVMRMLR